MTLGSIVFSLVLGAILSVLTVKSLKKDPNYNFSTKTLVLIYIISFIVLSAASFGIKYLLNTIW